MMLLCVLTMQGSDTSLIAPQQSNNMLRPDIKDVCKKAMPTACGYCCALGVAMLQGYTPTYKDVCMMSGAVVSIGMLDCLHAQFVKEKSE